MSWENIKNLLESTVHGFADWLAPDGPPNLNSPAIETPERSTAGTPTDAGAVADASSDLEAGLRALDQYHQTRDAAVAARQSDRRPFRLPTLWEIDPRLRARLGPVQARGAFAQPPGEATKVEVPPPLPVTHYAGLPLSDLLAMDETALGPTTNRGTFEETARPASRTQTAETAASAVAPMAYGGAIGGIYGAMLHPMNEGIQQCVDPAYAPYAVTVGDMAIVYGLHTWYSTAGGMPLAESNAAFAEGGPAVAATATVVGRGVQTALDAAGVDTTSDAGRTVVALTTGAGTGAAAAWMWPYLASTGPFGFGVGTAMYLLSDWQNNARSFTETVDHALDDTSLEWCDPTRLECLGDTAEVAFDGLIDGATWTAETLVDGAVGLWDGLNPLNWF